LVKYAVLFLNDMEKLRIILLYGIIFLLSKNTFGQSISLSNNDIAIQITSTDSLTNSINIVITNTSDNIIFISMIDSINHSNHYLGIGLYSSLFPYTPDYFPKYTKELQLLSINPADNLIFKLRSDFFSSEEFDISFDYMVKSNCINKKTKINRSLYDKHVSFLKSKISK